MVTLENKFVEVMVKLKNYGYKVYNSPDDWGYVIELDGGTYHVAFDDSHDNIEIISDGVLDIRIPYASYRNMGVSMTKKGYGFYVQFDSNGSISLD